MITDLETAVGAQLLDPNRCSASFREAVSVAILAALDRRGRATVGYPDPSGTL
jgi:hypothetical protein